ncbi:MULTISPECIES: cytochrome c oxidase subunit 4 [Saccharopolyspora]|uniref:Cytochrome c oxidase polypeptide 4 n=1 Tax=Saccharopolyspora gregorii TaxID=33914 RepID=A0ABP6RVK3_9PSEU|nr:MULTISPECIES: cytochrome c oxidase subunit 4 [Saccharopolyspora]MCA1187426.1 cytochrome c oxidase subunit 4 [Saccharopolyspora sp. 6T]MCA1192499.1 cytochrome c oxidase subunit 4 [Saccharopolyspora sp. 6V]MCA1224461.1 cytochrome c oxidase subunit 4 [Saccharopolyspora sp. 6M]MCA1281340.1 cytochrome c oxidase subunit 4 [Saccharopolyspora sp. 7B]
MKVEAKIFNMITGFFFLSAIVYGVWSHEPVGTVALILVGGLSLLIGSYFQFVARRIEPRPEDNPDAEISDGAGELGFFSPGSYWPVGLAAAAAFAGIALAFFHVVLIVISIGVLLIMVAGLVFEYHTGPNHD